MVVYSVDGGHAKERTVTEVVFDPMARPATVVSVLVALEFVAMSAVVLLIGPTEAVIGLVPLALFFLIVLVLYFR
jgi:hypothetical protein